MSACIASILRAVSRRVSPFTMLLDEGEKVITSALRRFAANSKEVRVRVLGSRNRLTTVLPLSAGTFLISRPLTSLKESAVSRISLISSADKDSILTRSFCLRLMGGLLGIQSESPPDRLRLLPQGRRARSLRAT